MSFTIEQFACPVPWCAGYVWDHGGDGLSAPDDWLHSSAPMPLAGTLSATLHSVGSGHARWAVYVGGGESAVSTDAPDAEQVAGTLESAARQLREVAHLAAAAGRAGTT